MLSYAELMTAEIKSSIKPADVLYNFSGIFVAKSPWKKCDYELIVGNDWNMGLSVEEMESLPLSSPKNLVGRLKNLRGGNISTLTYTLRNLGLSFEELREAIFAVRSLPSSRRFT